MRISQQFRIKNNSPHIQERVHGRKIEKDNPNEPDGKEVYYCKKEKYKQWGSKDPVSFL